MVNLQLPDGSLRYLLALLQLPGVGPAKMTELLVQYSDPKCLFSPQGTLRPPLEGTVDWRQVDQHLQWAEREDCHILTCQDPYYPPCLKHISAAPLILFVKGKVEWLSRPQIAIVGSRNPTPAGKETATWFAKQLSRLGITVTSGLALGIDACAHRGALSEAAGSIAVLGCGLSHIYPRSHTVLASEITQKGALVSEFPLPVKPLAPHFPRRNRLISGLSLGTLVIEAALKSGSLITARYALEQGREIFAVPGSIYSPLAKGCHQLIQEGAKLVETVEDVLEELELALGKAWAGPRAQKTALLPAPSTKDLAQVLEQVGYEATSLDSLLLRCGLRVSELSSKLLDLELEGFIVSVPGGYIRVMRN